MKHAVHTVDHQRAGRPSHRGRGLKHADGEHDRHAARSPLSQGARIETTGRRISPSLPRVAPLTGGAD